MNTLNLLGGRDKLFCGDIVRIEDELELTDVAH